MKIGESISFRGHQTQVIQPVSRPQNSTILLIARHCVFYFLLLSLPELLLLALSRGTSTWLRGTSVHAVLTPRGTVQVPPKK